jgi:hypothetical protein
MAVSATEMMVMMPRWTTCNEGKESGDRQQSHEFMSTPPTCPDRILGGSKRDLALRRHFGLTIHPAQHKNYEISMKSVMYGIG